MAIYGVALLAACVIVGLAVGEVLGWLIGVQANVGGVGVAMLLLVCLSQLFRKLGLFGPLSQQGVLFWSAMYIPIVVAVAASQNVAAAFRSGWVAFLAGGSAVALGFALVPVLSRLGSAPGLDSKQVSTEETRG